MFVFDRTIGPIAVRDVITIDTREGSRTVTVIRGSKRAERIPPKHDDGWEFFCQLIRSREDAHGVAYMMTASAGLSYRETIGTTKDVFVFDVLEAPKKEAKKK